jgi:hypothetical protein
MGERRVWYATQECAQAMLYRWEATASCLKPIDLPKLRPSGLPAASPPIMSPAAPTPTPTPSPVNGDLLAAATQPCPLSPDVTGARVSFGASIGSVIRGRDGRALLPAWMFSRPRR